MPAEGWISGSINPKLTRLAKPGGDAQIGKYRVEVVNMSGIRVLSAEMTGKMKQLFSISSMPSGLYFIHIISDEKAETVKLIKM